MHSFLVNASLQIIPLTTDRHPYQWVDRAIEVIKHSGISYEVGPFATVLEGNYKEVMDVVHQVNELLLEEGCPEWIANFQIQLRHDRDITALEKTQPHR